MTSKSSDHTYGFAYLIKQHNRKTHDSPRHLLRTFSSQNWRGCEERGGGGGGHEEGECEEGGEGEWGDVRRERAERRKEGGVREQIGERGERGDRRKGRELRKGRSNYWAAIVEPWDILKNKCWRRRWLRVLGNLLHVPHGEALCVDVCLCWGDIGWGGRGRGSWTGPEGTGVVRWLSVFISEAFSNIHFYFNPCWKVRGKDCNSRILQDLSDNQDKGQWG